MIEPPAPFLKYPGGKRSLLSEIARRYRPYRDCRLVDMFGGSAAVTFGLAPGAALVNDLNPHVMNLHRWVAKGWGGDCGVGLGGIVLGNEEQLFYQNRDRFNQTIRQDPESLEAAILLYYLNRTAYNGLIRFSRKSGYNAPFGRYRTVHYLNSFAPWHPRYHDITLTNLDFEQVPLRTTDFIYADPPYDEEGKKKFTTYWDKFDWTDQERLAQFLAQHPGPVLASNLATERIKKLYRRLGFRLRYVLVRRSIAANGDRPVVKEMLAFKPGR